MEYFTGRSLRCCLTILLLFDILYRGCFAQLTTTTTDQFAIVGDTITLNCSVENEVNVMLSWDIDWVDGDTTSIVCGDSSDTKPLNYPRGHYTSVYTTIENGTELIQSCSLTITDLTQADAGTFYCTLTPPGNSSVSEPEVISDNSDAVSNFELSVVQCLATSSLNLDQIITSMTFRNGIDFQFICNVSGNSESEITWLNNNNNDMISPQHNKGLFQHVLKASNNNEVFTCQVKPSSFMGDATLCQVTPLRIFPMITIFPKGTTFAMEGSSVTIECTDKASAEYITGYSWYYYNISISIDNPKFKVRTEEDLSSSTLTILDVVEDLNATMFTCKIHTEFGISSVETTKLSVMQQIDGNPTGRDLREEPNSWPIAIGVSLALTGFVVFSLLGVVFKRYRKPEINTNSTEKDDMNMMQVNGNGTANGHINPAVSETDDDDIFDQSNSPYQDYLDVTSGRRKSSMFRESFADLWRGKDMDLDNLSDTSSVSLPSYAAVSRSRPDLTADHSEEYKEATLKSHPPLSARVSAPASFTFNVNKTGLDGGKIKNITQEVNKTSLDGGKIKNITHDINTDNIGGHDDSANEEIDTVPDLIDTNKDKHSDTYDRPTRESQVSNMSVPSVTISFHDEEA